MTNEPTRTPMHCPRCDYEPADTRVVGSGHGPGGWTEMVPPTERWLDYVAHLLEHLVEDA